MNLFKGTPLVFPLVINCYSWAFLTFWQVPKYHKNNQNSLIHCSCSIWPWGERGQLPNQILLQVGMYNPEKCGSICPPSVVILERKQGQCLSVECKIMSCPIKKKCFIQTYKHRPQMPKFPTRRAYMALMQWDNIKREEFAVGKTPLIMFSSVTWYVWIFVSREELVLNKWLLPSVARVLYTGLNRTAIF